MDQDSRQSRCSPFAVNRSIPTGLALRSNIQRAVSMLSVLTDGEGDRLDEEITQRINESGSCHVCGE
jgi:hypothetical protein